MTLENVYTIISISCSIAFKLKSGHLKGEIMFNTHVNTVSCNITTASNYVQGLLFARKRNDPIPKKLKLY